MTNRLVVILEDVVAGSIERLSDGRLRFTYDEEYRSQSAPTPLSLSMPVQVSTHPDHIVTPWLQGLLPDNDRVLTRSLLNNADLGRMLRGASPGHV